MGVGPYDDPPSTRVALLMFVLKPRVYALISLAVVVPLGIGIKFYDGPLANWVSNSLGGVLYVIFWCLFLFAIFPRRDAINRIVIGVLLVTCAIEALQLWHPPFLERFRESFIGRTLIGTTFTPSDFLYYLIGAVIGWGWLHALSLTGNADPIP